MLERIIETNTSPIHNFPVVYATIPNTTTYNIIVCKDISLDK